VADIAAYIRVFDGLMRFGTVCVHPHGFAPKEFYYRGAENHVRAAVIHKDTRDRAILAEHGFPLAAILFGLYQAAFFKIPTAVVIPIEVTAFATVRHFHGF